jgi:hypothetical protein
MRRYGGGCYCSGKGGHKLWKKKKKKKKRLAVGNIRKLLVRDVRADRL